MRLCLVWLVLTSLAQLVHAADARAEAADSVMSAAGIVFDSRTVDFGVFEADSVQHGEFVFHNNGSEPLVLGRVFADCGCTVPSFSRDSVPPGGEGRISVTFNGRNRRPGPFKKMIKVRSNAVPPIVRISVIGIIKEK